MTTAPASSAHGGRTVAAAAFSTVLGSLPVFLLGGLAVLVRQDFALGELQLGLAVSTFFAVAAVSAVPAGRAVERLGAPPARCPCCSGVWPWPASPTPSRRSPATRRWHGSCREPGRGWPSA